MNGPLPANASRKRPGAEESSYLIDGFRVSFLHQAEWRCACKEFATAGTCRHAREAAGMRDAQALIRRRLLARASDFAPYARGLPVRRSSTQASPSA
jgi:hypothetical protein